MLLKVLRETVIDSLKLLPFLFAAYLAIEFIEDRAEEKTVALVHRAGRWGPVLGAALGVIPQCGFSAATANLYAGAIITRGTLLAVFLSTSDEMLPIFLAEQVPLYPLFHRQIATGYQESMISGFKPIATTGLVFLGASPKA